MTDKFGNLIVKDNITEAIKKREVSDKIIFSFQPKESKLIHSFGYTFWKYFPEVDPRVYLKYDPNHKIPEKINCKSSVMAIINYKGKYPMVMESTPINTNRRNKFKFPSETQETTDKGVQDTARRCLIEKLMVHPNLAKKINFECRGVLQFINPGMPLDNCMVMYGNLNENISSNITGINLNETSSSEEIELISKKEILTRKDVSPISKAIIKGKKGDIFGNGKVLYE